MSYRDELVEIGFQLGEISKKLGELNKILNHQNNNILKGRRRKCNAQGK